MAWKKVNNTDAGDATHFGGNDFDKIADLFSDVAGVDTVAIDSTVKVVDSKFTIRDNSDLTKAFAVECSGITTSTTRTMTVPNVDFTPVTIAENETITGIKTFGTAGGAVSKLKIAGATSGSTILDATAIAGSGTVTLPTTGTLATLAGTETLSGKTLTAPKFASGGFIADSNGNELIIFTTTASAVNELTLANAATTGAVTLSTTGGDTDVDCKLSPKGAGAFYGNLETLIVAISDETTAITTGTAKITFRMPYAFKVLKVKASLATASSSGIPTFDINEGGTTILSTKLTIDANELTSKTAATAAVISDDALADDAEITIDIDVAGTGAKGAKIYIIGYATAKFA